MSITAQLPDVTRMPRTEAFQNPVPPASKRIIRRRPTQTQGKALEKLGHAVEYLVDSRMALIHEPSTRADAEALDILMRLSRSVFADCEEIVPIGRRLKEWVTGVASVRVN